MGPPSEIDLMTHRTMSEHWIFHMQYPIYRITHIMDFATPNDDTQKREEKAKGQCTKKGSKKQKRYTTKGSESKAKVNTPIRDHDATTQPIPEVESSLMVRWVVGSILHGVDPLSYFSFQLVLHDWCNKGRGMCYPVCGMVHIKEPLLLIDKSSLCGGSGFPFSLSEWSLTICLMPYNRR